MSNPENRSSRRDSAHNANITAEAARLGVSPAVLRSEMEAVRRADPMCYRRDGQLRAAVARLIEDKE